MSRIYLLSFFVVALLMAYWLSPFRVQDDLPAVVSQEVSQTVELPEKVKPVRIRIAKPAPQNKSVVEQVKKKPDSKPKPKKQLAHKTGAKGGGANSGTLNIVGEFACDIDFYLETMHLRGARTMLFERTSRQMYALSLSGEIGASVELDARFSRVSRRLTQDFPQARQILRKAEILYGPGRYEILLLVTQSFADKIENRIRAALIQNGQESTNGTVFVRYKRSADQLLVDIYKASINGKTVRLNKQYAL